jgi:hypothetical protein
MVDLSKAVRGARKFNITLIVSRIDILHPGLSRHYILVRKNKFKSIDSEGKAII